MPPSMIIKKNVFDILKKKSKDYNYTMLIRKKAQFSNNSLVLKHDFKLNEDQLRKVFLLPHVVCSETSGGSRGVAREARIPPPPPLFLDQSHQNPIKHQNCERAKTKYLRAGPHLTSRSGSATVFQHNVLNFILYTNTKLHKIGYVTDNKCSFCESQPETLLHFLFNCVYSKLFWKDFELYFYYFSREFVHLSLQDVLIGIITSEWQLLNYFLLIAKLDTWDCRRSQILPSLAWFKIKTIRRN